MFNFLRNLFTTPKPMSRYTVVFTSTPRGLRSFRSVEAATESQAVALVKANTVSFIELIEVLPFVGGY